jgi:uncharacterized protein YcnI
MPVSTSRNSRRPRRLRRPSGRIAIAGALVASAATMLTAAPASAHVTVGSDTAQQGAGDAILTFRVPDEEATASTVKVQIVFPKTTPLAMVKPAAKPGWTFATTKVTFNPPIKTDDGTITDGVASVTYTADSPAAGIPVGGFDTFQVLVGPLPDKTDALAFPTVQTYSDGKSVSWSQPVTDPVNEPDNPVPILHLTAGGQKADAAPSGTAPAPNGTPTVTANAVGGPGAPAESSSGTDSGTRTLAISALVVAVLGLITAATGAVVALRRRDTTTRA